MSSRIGIWNEINSIYIDDDKLMKGVKNRCEMEMTKDQEALEVLMQFVLSSENGKSFGLRKLDNPKEKIYQIYCQFNLESLPKNLIDNGIRKLLHKGLLI